MPYRFDGQHYIDLLKSQSLNTTSQRPGSSSEEPQGWMGYLSKAVSVSASYLPTQVADVFSQGRAFATVHLPFQGIRNVCALAT